MRRSLVKRVFRITFIIVFMAGPVMAKAETRALLVGVGDYTSPLIPHLRGPANDVGAMESLMRAEGAVDITVLRDHDATRTSVEKAIHDLGARSKKGDWIVLYFSGHGAQAQAAIKGTVDGDLDQFLVLSGFDLEKPDPEQYIIDKDFYAWMARYVPPDVEVLHIADACHSGTLNRSIDMRAWSFTPRLAFSSRALNGEAVQLTARPAPRYDPVLPEAATRSISTDRADLPNVIFIGAAQDTQLALEASLPVQGAPSRGLLTYSLEQAFTTIGADGKSLAADTDGDGALSVAELSAYVQSQTRTMTGQRQMPSAHFVAGAESTLLLKAQQPKPAKLASPPVAPLPGVFSADPDTKALLSPHTAWRVAASAGQADFVWDRIRGQVLRRSGDVVAENVTAIESLRGVLEKWQAVDALRPFLAEQQMQVVVGPKVNGARYPKGARVQVGIEGAAAAAGRYLTVVNLASNGEVELLYPVKDDGAGQLSAGPRQVMETEVVQPYGADQIIAVASTERPDALRRTLSTINGSRAAPVLAEAIRTELAKGPKQASLSIGELYTGAP
jgi:hypothetical protein